MKFYLRLLTVALLLMAPLTALLFACVAFVAWDANPGHWHEGHRMVFSLVFGCFSIFAASVVSEAAHKGK